MSTRDQKKIIEKLRSRSFRGIIFDFDGTLLDIKEPLKNAIEEVFEEKKIQADMEFTIQEIGSVLESIQGYPIPKILLQSYDIFKCVTVLNNLRFLEKLRIAGKIFSKYLTYAKEAKIFPAAKQLISYLNKSCDLFIVSHNQTINVLETLQREGFENYFPSSKVYGADKLPALKPNPDAFLPILERYMDIKGSEWLIFGDMPSDIEAGKEAGLCTLGIASGISKKEVLANCRPDLMVNSLTELIDLINIENDRISNSKAQDLLKIKS